MVLDLCRELGIVINLEKSNLVPSQVVQYLGVVIDAHSFVASPSLDHIARLLVNSWRISILRRSSRQYLALAARHAVLAVPSRSEWSAPHAVAPAVSPPVLGSGGSVNPGSLVSGLPPGSEVVATLAPPFSRSVSPSSVFRPGLLVRRLGRRLGGLTWVFSPLQASGAKRKVSFPSTPGNFWLYAGVSSTCSHL